MDRLNAWTQLWLSVLYFNFNDDVACHSDKICNYVSMHVITTAAVNCVVETELQLAMSTRGLHR